MPAAAGRAARAVMGRQDLSVPLGRTGLPQLLRGGDVAGIGNGTLQLPGGWRVGGAMRWRMPATARRLLGGGASGGGSTDS